MPIIARRVLLVLILLFVSTRELEAQRWREPPTLGECETWMAQLAAGDTAAMSALTYGYIPGCAAAPYALASAVRAARPSQDTTFLRALAGDAGDVRDVNLFAAALEVAGDRSASNASRVMSLLVVVAHMGLSQDPLVLNRSQLFTQALPASGPCGFELPGDGGPAIDNALPEDAELLAAQVMDGIRYNTAEPALLRNLARCARTTVSFDIPPQVDPTKLQLSYQCGNRFWIRNQSGAQLPVTMKITADNGATESFFTEVPATHFVILYEALMTGTVEMWYNGHRVATSRTPGRSGATAPLMSSDSRMIGRAKRACHTARVSVTDRAPAHGSGQQG